MATIKTIAKCVTIVMLCTITNFIYAQVIDLQTAGLQRWGRVNPVPGFNAHGISIGNFAPAAALHVNTNFLPATTLFTPGEVFRTSGPSTQLNAWRLFTGAGNGTEKFNINVPANSNNVNITVFQLGNMNFFTNNVQRAIISATGNVGIGTNFLAPNNLLDVDGGDIDVNTPTRGYMIGNNYVLRHNGINSNIFVGVNAGPLTTGNMNTFVGNNAGSVNTTGFRNVFVGMNAGQSNTNGDGNAFVGCWAGRFNTTGSCYKQFLPCTI